MLDLNTIVEKRKTYCEMLQSLEQRDISAEVENRLQGERCRITREIEAETEADKLKCKHYVAVLDELINDAASDAFNVANNNVENVEESVSESQENCEAQNTDEIIGG